MVKIKTWLSDDKNNGFFSPNPDFPSLTIPDQSMTVQQILRRVGFGQVVQNAMGVRYTIPSDMSDEEAFAVYRVDRPIDELTYYDDFARSAMSAFQTKQERDASYAAAKRQTEDNLRRKLDSIPDPTPEG